MTRFNQEFKVKSVEKVLSRGSGQTIKQIAKSLGVGYSTLQKWVRLAKENKLEKIMSKKIRGRYPLIFNGDFTIPK